jgi:hypothetical protein
MEYRILTIKLGAADGGPTREEEAGRCRIADTLELRVKG